MTDKEKLLALLAGFGISPVDETGYHHDAVGENSVVLEAQHGGVEGYPYFFCRFTFDQDGAFQRVGIWE